MTLPAIKQVAVYEPPLAVGRSIDWRFVDRLRQDVAAGHLGAALATATKGTQMFGRSLPRWALASMARLMLNVGERRPDGTQVTLRDLTPAFQQDIDLVQEAADGVGRYSALTVPLLLLGGRQSPAYLKTALGALQRVVPHAQRVQFAGLNHGGSANRNRGGRPDLVAARLRTFLIHP